MQESYPTYYLFGFTFNANPLAKISWKSLVLHIENRLNPWKKKFLSKGGRLALIKAIISTKVINDGFKVIIGRGNRAPFWEDVRGVSRSLKNECPRIFALATKSGKVDDFGEEQPHGRLGVGFLPNGSFSSGSFRRKLEEAGIESLQNNDLLWQRIFPPKVEIFVWQLLRGRTMVKDVLHRFSFSPNVSLACQLCNSGVESVNHLFLHCSWSWSLWSSCMGWGDINCCPNGTLLEWAVNWDGLCPAKKSERAWQTLFVAVIWTLWEKRNHVVFKGQSACVAQTVDMVKFQVAWWFKHQGKGSTGSITHMILNLKVCCTENVNVRRAKDARWIPPPLNILKFNVDGSTRRSPGDAGIGGVMCDSNGKVWCIFFIFSYFVGVQNSYTAEILAIQKAIDLCTDNPEVAGREILITSDSKIVVSWVHSDDFGSIDNL
ncbi:hypothetical protein Dsin_023725 [Dipteronia sinensis]|uniref:Reverse transcriptase zinc-binding domain-containing protein n=1 Tax=Dipteronia sinensis TaxID=43782 RepID=A0AAE0A3W4_9ROSI|nr:hypothetical protein Dsin_023725 [Dipteronia sinensis]